MRVDCSLPERSVECNGVPITPEEHRKLLEVRLAALEAATAQSLLEQPLPVQWRGGWRAYLVVLWRDTDGSLGAVVRVRNPLGELVYRRHVRLCKMH